MEDSLTKAFTASQTFGILVVSLLRLSKEISPHAS